METFLTISELAAALQVPESWVYARTAPSCPKAARIPHYKFGRHIRFDQEQVLRWMAANERNGHQK